jgi:hypothetical protein
VVVVTTNVGLLLPDAPEVIPADFEGDIKIAQMVKGDAWDWVTADSDDDDWEDEDEDDDA